MKPTLLHLLFWLVLAMPMAAQTGPSFLTQLKIAHPERPMEIRLEANSELALYAKPDKSVSAQKKGTQFKIVPGRSSADCVSFELVEPTVKHYLRHNNFIVWSQQPPKGRNLLYDADTSFKPVVDKQNGRVRFEAANHPGYFLAVRDDGLLLIMKRPADARSYFVIVER